MVCLTPPPPAFCTLGLDRIHQVTNTNIGWRIRLCIREYSFFSEAIYFIRQCSKLFHTLTISVSSSFSLRQGWGAAPNFFTASSDSLFHPPLSLVFFFQSSSSPAFLTSLLTQSSHLRLGRPRLLLPCSRNSSALCGSLSSAIFLRVLPTVVCSSPISLPMCPFRTGMLVSHKCSWPYHLVFWRSAGPSSTPQLFSTRSLRPVLFDIPLSPSSRPRTLPLLGTQNSPWVSFFPSSSMSSTSLWWPMCTMLTNFITLIENQFFNWMTTLFFINISFENKFVELIPGVFHQLNIGLKKIFIQQPLWLCGVRRHHDTAGIIITSRQ